jgi:hypothetical protein
VEFDVVEFAILDNRVEKVACFEPAFRDGIERESGAHELRFGESALDNCVILEITSGEIYSIGFEMIQPALD